MRRSNRFAALALAAFAAVGVAAEPQQAAPAPSTAPVPKGAYEIDKLHTSILFRVSHIGFSLYTGRFTRYDATLQFDPAHIANSSLNVTIDPRSIEADNAPAGFLETLAGKDWLDAERFPQMTFRSTRIEPKEANTFRIHGDFTLHGVTRPIVLDARYNGGYASHPYEPRARVGFAASGSIKRSDFGISIGLPAPGTDFGVGDEVQIELQAEFSGPPLEQKK